jgi:AcrR family transcriptional regulator
MTTDLKLSSRERLLDAAAALTYREGVNIGIDALCKAAGVSKRSMYQLFTSKDELLAASLERRASSYVAGLLPAAAEGDLGPRERITYVFDQVASQSTAPEFRGCPYLSAEIELKNPDHPASRVAREVKGNLTAYFRAAAQQGGASDPDLLARQLTLVFDGASARAGVGAEHLDGLLAPTVAALLDAADLH